MIAMKRLQSHFTYFEYPLKFISHFRIKIHSNPALTFISNNFPTRVQLEKSSSEYSKFRKFNSQRKCIPHRIPSDNNNRPILSNRLDGNEIMVEKRKRQRILGETNHHRGHTESIRLFNE